MEKYIQEAIVVEKAWSLDDSFLMIPVTSIQLFEVDGWKEGDRVILRIEVVKK